MDQTYYSFVFVIILIIVLSLLHYHLTSSYGYWKKRSIPCVDGVIPGIGNVLPMILMKRNFADMYRDFYNRMPEHSMIGFYNLREPSLIVRDPELVKTVLSDKFKHFTENHLQLDPELDPLLSADPFFADGDRWNASRQQITSSFTPSKLKYMYKSVNEACVIMKEYLNTLIKSSNGQVELELKELFSNYTAEVIASAVFGVKDGSFESHKDGPFREIARLLFEPSFVKGLTQTMTMFYPAFGKIFKARILPVSVDRFFRKVVKDVLKQREKEGIQRADFIQLMIQYKNANKVDPFFGQEFNDDIITARATSFFDDSFETLSITLSFFTYQLAAHSKVQDRVREEVTNVVAKHGGLTYDALQEMTYMDQALHESMRLFPAFGALMKSCTKETELIGSDGITCQVTPGMLVVIPAAALQRDPEHWPDPEKFDPERFSKEDTCSRHKFVYLPFGEGPRVCPGIKMATLQIKASIATIIQNFTWELSPRTKQPIQLDPNYFLAAAIGGLWVNMKRL